MRPVTVATTAIEPASPVKVRALILAEWHCHRELETTVAMSPSVLVEEIYSDGTMSSLRIDMTEHLGRLEKIRDRAQWVDLVNGRAISDMYGWAREAPSPTGRAGRVAGRKVHGQRP